MEKSCLLDTREIARQRDRQGVSNGGLRPSVRSNTCSFILIILLQGQTEHLRRRECLTQCKIWDTRSYKAKQDICSFSEYLGRATVKLLQNRNAFKLLLHNIQQRFSNIKSGRIIVSKSKWPPFKAADLISQGGSFYRLQTQSSLSSIHSVGSPHALAALLGGNATDGCSTVIFGLGGHSSGFGMLRLRNWLIKKT